MIETVFGCIKSFGFIDCLQVQLCFSCPAGLQITDASCFSDCIPSDAHQPGIPARDDQKEGQQTDRDIPGPNYSPQRSPFSGQQLPVNHHSSFGRRPSISSPRDYGQTPSIPGGQLPVTNSGSVQKRRVAGESLLGSNKRSKQTTLDGSLRASLTTGSQSAVLAGRQCFPAIRQSSMAPAHSSWLNQQEAAAQLTSSGFAQTPAATPTAHAHTVSAYQQPLAGAVSSPHEQQPPCQVSPFGSVAQVLDLTQEPGDGSSAGTGRQGAAEQAGASCTAMLSITGSSQRSRRQFLLHSKEPGPTASELVDLT